MKFVIASYHVGCWSETFWKVQDIKLNLNNNHHQGSLKSISHRKTWNLPFCTLTLLLIGHAPPVAPHLTTDQQETKTMAEMHFLPLTNQRRGQGPLGPRSQSAVQEGVSTRRTIFAFFPLKTRIPDHHHQTSLPCQVPLKILMLFFNLTGLRKLKVEIK